ncbi:MAG TPA: PRC-barrel domain-containing protein, partial [Solirubrobacteraceae bacterium]|nr:PRC-barrel domain-containing protein [Solirubrobacteraceae bacterium]
MTQQLVHLSGLLGSPLVDRSGERLGRVEDVIVRMDEDFPPVTGLKGRLGERELFIPTDRIASLSSDSAQLSGELLDLRRFERRPGEVLLGEDVLGRKLIDVEAARLVTAHEIELANVDGWWRVMGINPSRRARLRRLLRFGSSSGHRDGEPMIEWTQLEPFVGHVPTSRLRIRHRKLAQLHPAQIADLVEAASHDEGEEIIQAVGQDRELEADVFEELDDQHQVEFIRERTDEEAAKLIARMAADDSADLITELEQERREPILSLLPPRQQRRVRQLLGYNPSTAGGLMSPDYIALPETASVAEAIRRVRDSDIPPETAVT